MNNETLTVLNTLAAKLGTTAEYLWSVLLKQAPITGVTDLILLVALIAFTVVYVNWVMSKPFKDDMNESIAWFGVIGLVLLTIVVTMSSTSTIFAALFNPEYWALRQILHP